MTGAVVLGVGAAFATRHDYDCSSLPQYYYAGGNYYPVGTEGVDYTCTQSNNTCTYYTTDNIHYYECHAGTFVHN